MEEREPMVFLEETNTSRVLYVGRCRVYSFSISCGGADGHAELYDEQNAQGTVRLRLYAKDNYSERWTAGKGVTFRKGVYIAVSAATTFASVEYEIIKD